MSILIHQAGKSHWVIEADQLAEPEQDFDILTVHEAVYAASVAAAAETYDKGQSHGTHAYMFHTESVAKELVHGSGYYDLVSTWKGLARDKPAKFDVRSFAERNSYSSVRLLGTALSTYPGPADVSEPRASITVRWISFDPPDMSIIGTQVAPPITVAPPASVWSLIVGGVVGYPDGWVLDSREGPGIPGAEAWSVTDIYTYYQGLRPSR